MEMYVVCFDRLNPDADLTQFFQVLSKWWGKKMLDSVWVITTGNETPRTITDALLASCSRGSLRLFVTEVGLENWGGASLLIDPHEIGPNPLPPH